MSTCPYCHQPLLLDQTPPGQAVACPFCGGQFSLQSTVQAPPPPPEYVIVPSPRVVQTSDRTSSPVRRNKAQKPIWPWVLMLVILLAVLSQLPSNSSQDSPSSERRSFLQAAAEFRMASQSEDQTSWYQVSQMIDNFSSGVRYPFEPFEGMFRFEHKETWLAYFRFKEAAIRERGYHPGEREREQEIKRKLGIPLDYGR